jgi:para-aminobenzoate synthetase/4-amino-4-deoxychorismate lyase
MKILIQFENKPLLFQNPDFIISCANPAAFTDSFQQIELALKHGYYLAGFFSYEAGYFFEERLKENKTYAFPLIYLGAYKAPQRNNLRPCGSSGGNILENLRLNIARDKYNSHIRAIREHIAKGDVYQITYCLKLLFSFRGDPFALYHTLLKEQPVPYPAYIETDKFNILSLSPEMFIKKRSTRIMTKPMKGTWQRGRNILSDAFNRLRFQYDEKNRAENLMIADLLRNDLGRIGAGIKTPRLFEISGYKKLFQMTSTVTADIDKEIPVYQLLSALFPSGSVTGAPKIRAMGIIREL